MYDDTFIVGKKRRVEDEAYASIVIDDDTVNEEDGVPGAASKNVEKNDEQIQEDEFGAKDYRFVIYTF